MSLHRTAHHGRIDLTCWFLNYRRIGELLGSEILANAPPPSDLPFGNLPREVFFKDALLSWVRSQKPPTLQQLIIESRVSSPQFFTLYTKFYCTRRGKRPCIRTTISDLNPVYKVEMPFSAEHFTSNSSSSEIQGLRRLFVIAYLQDIESNTISARPYAMADIIPRGDRSFPPLQPWNDYMQVFIENISSFSTIRNEGLPAIKDLTILRDIPESAVKQAIAEIIDETTEPDWGGEQSDLYTSHLTVNGKRVTAAFIFKGPAKFHPMTMADLGKNGDQICRLFQEPADLFILQHCHKVTSAVRAHMRAFVTQIGAPKAFCIIDGSDTLRLLRAYKKCGQKPTVKPPTIPPNNDPDDWDE